MAKRTVPARVIYVCDRCRAEFDMSGAGGLHARDVESWGRDAQGNGGGASIDFDFCNPCSVEFFRWMKKP